MNVKLIYCSPLWLISNGIRYSHNNHHLSDSKILYRDNGAIETTLGSKDFDLIKRVGFKMKHESVLEHSILVFHIECSRATLQEISRHRHISLTVKSTRYTLKELANIEPTDEELRKYLVLTKNYAINNFNIQQLKAISLAYKKGYTRTNDIAKYALPEAFKTELQLTANLRELVHILKLRITKDALWEFRQIAYQMFNVLPEEYKKLILCDKQIAKQIKEIEND